MQMQYSYRAIDKEFHEPWQRALGNVIEHALKPLLDKHTKDSAQLQIVLDRDKIKRQFLASGLLSIVLGAIVLWIFFSRPVESFLAAGWLLGFYAAVYGVTLLFLSWRLRKTRQG